MSTKKIIYIAGKVTGLPIEQVTAKFKRYQEQLETQGYEVINPVEVIRANNEILRFHGEPELASWEDEMKTCITIMVNCHELHLLPCWQQSRGATLERDIAVRLNIPIVHH